MEDSFVKNAERMCINRAKEMTDMLAIVDALAHAGGRMFKTPYQIEDFSEGLRLIRRSFHDKYVQAIADCFHFVGIGGEEAKKYSKEKLNETFGKEDRYCIMHLLDQYGNTPDSYNGNDDEEFRKEIKNKLK